MCKSMVLFSPICFLFICFLFVFSAMLHSHSLFFFEFCFCVYNKCELNICAVNAINKKKNASETHIQSLILISIAFAILFWTKTYWGCCCVCVLLFSFTNVLCFSSIFSTLLMWLLSFFCFNLICIAQLEIEWMPIISKRVCEIYSCRWKLF